MFRFDEGANTPARVAERLARALGPNAASEITRFARHLGARGSDEVAQKWSEVAAMLSTRFPAAGIKSTR